MESFVSGADPGVLSRIRSTIDMSIIWDRLVCCIDASLEGRPLEEPTSPGKDIPALAHTVFFTLGVFDRLERGELKMKVRSLLILSPVTLLTPPYVFQIYSVRLTGWADFSAEDGYLQSGIRGGTTDSVPLYDGICPDSPHSLR